MDLLEAAYVEIANDFDADQGRRFSPHKRRQVRMARDKEACPSFEIRAWRNDARPPRNRYRLDIH
jgi:hypothetical protein